MTRPIVWIDVETTGLRVGHDDLLEIGMIATDENLDPISGPPELDVLLQPFSLDLMKIDPGVVAMHAQSGLWEALREDAVSFTEAERQIRIWLLNLGNYGDGPYVVAGSTVGFDRGFFKEEFPALNDEFLHYRSIDVSTVKELIRRWYGDDALPKLLEDPKEHRSLADLRVSIEELRFYRKHYFKSAMSPKLAT